MDACLLCLCVLSGRASATGQSIVKKSPTDCNV